MTDPLALARQLLDDARAGRPGATARAELASLDPAVAVEHSVAGSPIARPAEAASRGKSPGNRPSRQSTERDQWLSQKPKKVLGSRVSFKLCPSPGNSTKTDSTPARTRALCVLITSGYALETLAARGRLRPGTVFLNKPYRKGDLARRLREALNVTA